MCVAEIDFRERARVITVLDCRGQHCRAALPKWATRLHTQSEFSGGSTETKGEREKE